MSGAAPCRLSIVSAEPVLRALLREALRGRFDTTPASLADADPLGPTRATQDAGLILLDSDGIEGDPAAFVAGLTLIGAAPVIVLSATAAPGSPVALALFRAGAEAVLHKPAGRLPLDLGGGFGAQILLALDEAAQAR
ncbi:hypothetical protein C8P66_10730 [Humitalea rosea]|uniref:Response regulatory domain-containing protein n=1 Tax=Humitalea rosea TaxID=990373 RepID=A0A2W7KGP7_9PROT|nr:hypothetical protein [Humitalea rosea]PZW46993.1 hypothetical protein C8P66_10730 [Humitalea rosea]